MGLRSLLSRLSHPRLSISTRLALWYGLSLLILLSLFVVYLYTSVHVGLHRDFERHLRAEAHTIMQRLDDHQRAMAAPPSPIQHLYGSYGTFVRVLRANGQVLRASKNFDRRSSFPPHLPEDRTQALRVHTWEGERVRSLYHPIAEQKSAGPAALWLEVTRLESSIHREMHRLGWLLALGIAMSVVVAIGTGYGMAHRALRPVAALTKAARDIQEEPTGQLPTDFGVRDELTDLAETFNAMLQRIRQAFKRERHFRSDAAHKMFTPLTAIQSELDVTLRKSRSEADYRAALEAIGRHTEALSGMLDELMTLSEVESLAMQDHQVASLDLAQRVRKRAQHFEARARRRAIDLQIASLESGPVALPTRYADTLIDNLIDNALKYTPRGGCVQVEVHRTDAEMALRVTDDGIGFDPSGAHRLFDRFYRSAQAAEEAQGSGLGLSIVQAIAERYNGDVQAQSRGAGHGSTFTVRLPRADKRPSQVAET
ncbi:sensor histidine kinase [Salisaeta longa]|uniref:sensor histidine kinase n=1 Tax=Salisaeta longa TaxID=503170 RepID=UPI0003B684D3|nr:ATP-binding protein [Salisaeta longa]